MNKKVYYLVLLFCLVAYVWIAYNFFYRDEHNQFTVCFIKNITGMPCPSCGITRSIIQILQGNFAEGLLINPLGLVAVVTLIALPIWIWVDIFCQRFTLLATFKKAERLLYLKAIYIPLIILCLLNWYWNILKDL